MYDKQVQVVIHDKKVHMPLYVLARVPCRCPVLMVTGAKASFNSDVKALFNRMRVTMDKKQVDFLEVDGIANVIEEKVTQLSSSLQQVLPVLTHASLQTLLRLLSSLLEVSANSLELLQLSKDQN